MSPPHDIWVDVYSYVIIKKMCADKIYDMWQWHLCWYVYSRTTHENLAKRVCGWNSHVDEIHIWMKFDVWADKNHVCTSTCLKKSYVAGYGVAYKHPYLHVRMQKTCAMWFGTVWEDAWHLIRYEKYIAMIWVCHASLDVVGHVILWHYVRLVCVGT